MAFIESMHRNKPNITYLLTEITDKSSDLWPLLLTWFNVNPGMDK